MTSRARRSRTPRGHFGEFGGKFVPETLMPALARARARLRRGARRRPLPARSSTTCSRTYVGRPTPLTYARPPRARRSADARRAKVYLKREDLAHTGAHKINAALAQALLAKRMGKRRIVAETGAGQHGVATATVCALLRPRVQSSTWAPRTSGASRSTSSA